MSKIIQSSECSICREHYAGNRVPHFLPCGHIMCNKCIARLQPTECPVDRKPFELDDVKRVFNAAEEKTARQKVTEFANIFTEGCISSAYLYLVRRRRRIKRVGKFH